MDRLRELVEKRREVGKRKSYTTGGSYNDYIEYNRIGELIIKEVERMYDDGELN